MGNLPARCTLCGHLFPMTALQIRGSGSIHLNNSITNCPRCGGVAVAASGTFSEAGGIFHMVSGPPESRRMMEQLYGVARKAKDEDLSAKEIIAELAEINPELAQKLGRKRLPAFILIIILFLIVRHFNVEADVHLDINHLVDQAYHLSQHEDPEQHLDEVIAKEPSAESNEAAKQPAKESRQARRHRERQAKKRAPPPRP